MTDHAPEGPLVVEIDDASDRASLAPFPPYVVTVEQKLRWALCRDAARLLSEAFEPDHRASAEFVQAWTRTAYTSDLTITDVASPDDPTPRTLNAPGHQL